MKTRSQVLESFHLATDETARLLELSRVSSPADPSQCGPLFRRLRDRLATLPLPQDTYALLTNMVSDAEALIARREFGASHWQLRQTSRRLRRLETEWADDAEPAVRQTSPLAKARH